MNSSIRDPRYDALKEKVRALPTNPGVYLYKDFDKTIIYVGKAKNLKNRVSSYFANNLDPRSKTFALVQRINDIEHVDCETEFEALLLEAELIKKHRPFYNISLKDDKSYIYIVVDKHEALPKIITARKTDLEKIDSRKNAVFGPYPDGGTVRYILKHLRKVFPFRDCSTTKFSKYKKLGSPCLFGHINLCPGPCVHTASEEIQKYKRNIHNIQNILSGKSFVLLHELEKKMQAVSKAQNYEEAVKYRDLIQKFNYVRQSFREINSYVQNPYLLEDVATESLTALTTLLPFLKEKPTRIECYDISNLSGKEAVGSMVVATNGKVNKSLYKKFRIKLKQEPDDFAMMHEVLVRRLTRLDQKGWEKPDLLIVDGGKGQITSALKAQQQLNVNIPIVGIAKKFETLVYLQDGVFVEVKLPEDNAGLKLVVRLRDEAHRFAQKYHHYLREKQLRLSKIVV